MELAAFDALQVADTPTRLSTVVLIATVRRTAVIGIGTPVNAVNEVPNSKSPSPTIVPPVPVLVTLPRHSILHGMDVSADAPGAISDDNAISVTTIGVTPSSR